MTKTEQRWFWMAGALWLVSAGAIAVLVAINPQRCVDPIYYKAVTNWWARHTVYTNPLGFNYLPSFFLLFGLFAWLPGVVGDILWRWAAFAGIGFGLWRCCKLMASRNRYQAFAVVSGLSLSISLSALHNGQSSAQLAACLVLAAWCLQEQRWWLATLWLSLSLVCKPLGIVAIGLAVMAFPRIWWRMAVGVALVFVAPYFFAPPGYVSEQYAGFIRNIVECFDTSGRSFADLNGVLALLDLKLTGVPSLVVRVTAGAAMAVGCCFVGKLGADIRRVLLWLGFTGIYIMLFTPMNEANSYVMLAPALGLWTWWQVEHGATRTAVTLGAMPLSAVVLSNVIRHAIGKIDGDTFARFWCPFVTIIFLGILLWQMKQALAELRDDPGALSYGATAP